MLLMRYILANNHRRKRFHAVMKDTEVVQPRETSASPDARCLSAATETRLDNLRHRRRRTKRTVATQQSHTRVAARAFAAWARWRPFSPSSFAKVWRSCSAEVPTSVGAFSLTGVVQQTVRCWIEPRFGVLLELGAVPGALRAR